MKERVNLSRAEKEEICKKRFEEGKSSKELMEEYGVCQRTILRISEKYRKEGKEAFKKKVKEKKKESAEEAVKRLEEENAMLKDLNKLLTYFSKKNKNFKV